MDSRTTENAGGILERVLGLPAPPSSPDAFKGPSEGFSKGL